MRNLMILGVFILMAVSGLAQTNEDGDRILKSNGIISKNDELSEAISHGRCKTIFNTPNGIYITTIEWIGNTKRFRPVIYLYVDYNTNFDNGKLKKIESLKGFFAHEYSEKLNMLLISRAISSLEENDNLKDSIFNVNLYTYDLTSKTENLQVTGNHTIEGFTFSTNSDSIKYSAPQKNERTYVKSYTRKDGTRVSGYYRNIGGVGSSYVTKSVKIK